MSSKSLDTDNRSDSLDRGIRFVLWNFGTEIEEVLSRSSDYPNLDSSFDSARLQDFDLFVISIAKPRHVEQFLEKVPLKVDQSEVLDAMAAKSIHTISLFFEGSSALFDVIFVPYELYSDMSLKCVAFSLNELMEIPSWPNAKNQRLLSLFDCGL